MALGDVFDNIRGTIDNLNERERRLLLAMGSVAFVLFTIVPLYVLNASISNIEEENAEIVQVMRDIGKARARLDVAKREREAIAQRFTSEGEPLGSLLEEHASQKGLEGLDVNDQPKLQMGEYVRRSVRASLPRVQLKPFIEMLADIKNSNHPVALEKIQIDGARSSGERSVRFTVNAYDRAGAEIAEEE